MRKLAGTACSFAVGIFLAQYLLPFSVLLPAAVCIAVFGGGAAFLKKEPARLRILLLALGFSAALGYNWLYASLVQLPAEQLAGTEQQATMTLCGYPEETDYGAKVTVKLDALRFGKAVYYGERDLLDLQPGNRITAEVSFGSASHIREDDVTAFTSKGVFLLAYHRDGAASVESGNVSSVRWWPVRVGHAMQIQISKLFSGDTAGFLTAILTGEKSQISEETSDILSEVGLSHILAVSGMHCAFLLAMLTFLIGRQHRRILALSAIPLLIFYMVLTGGSPSVVRACIMLIFLLLAPLFGRERDTPTALFSALMVILLANPFAAASVSLQLSFAAVSGILWLTPKLAGPLLEKKNRSRGIRFLAVSAATTLGAMIFTVPLCALYFNTLSLIAPLSGILCLWTASLIFCLGMAAVLLSFLWLPLGQLIGLIPRGLIWYFLKMSGLLAKVPYHAVYFRNSFLKYWLVYLYVLFAAAYLMKQGGRRKYVLAGILGAVTLSVTMILGQFCATYGQFNCTVLDVGQGESVLLTSGDEFALIDCGSGNSWYDAGAIALQNLESMGCRSLKYLMLTHYDSDHVSGVSKVLNAMKVDTLLIPDAQDDAGIREIIVSEAEQAGVEVQTVTDLIHEPLGETVLTVYPPLGDSGDNECGLAYLCSAGDYDLLVTGDMGGSTEKKLLETYRLPEIETLVVGHHGSRYSTSEELLSALKPETAVISVGSNSYGHPTPQTLSRLKKAGAAVYRTDVQGNIHITVN